MLLAGAVGGALWTSTHPGAIVGGAASLDAWRDVLSDPRFLEALRFTSVLAALTTALALPLALIGAVAVRSSRLGLLAMSLPIPVPHLVVAAVAVVVLGPGGLADRVAGELAPDLVGDPNGLGIVFVYLYKEVPFLVLVVLAGWTSDSDELLEAAEVAGAGRWRRTVDVLLPRITPGLAVAAAVVAAFVVGAAEIPLLVGPSGKPTVATYAIDVVRLDGPAARPAATVALLAATAAAAAAAGTAALAVTATGRWAR
ncbi:MAG: ABC transporter permease subunit [Dehalococcoidia bacterium]